MGIRSLGNPASSFSNKFGDTGINAAGESGSGGPIVATGGTKTTVGSYTVHTFTSPGTFTITSGEGNIEYLVVAGGGGGYNSIGNQNSGGGGGGTGPGGPGGTPGYGYPFPPGGPAGDNGQDRRGGGGGGGGIGYCGVTYCTGKKGGTGICVIRVNSA